MEMCLSVLKPNFTKCFYVHYFKLKFKYGFNLLCKFSYTGIIRNCII